MTYVTGDTGNPVSEPAAFKFAMYRDGGLSGFTTMIVELAYNGGVTEDVWQTTNLDANTKVWQTTDDGGFCNQATQCTFAEFKTQYPDAAIATLNVGLGTGIAAVTSYVDGITFTADGATDTWDFELAAVPPPTRRTVVVGQP